VHRLLLRILYQIVKPANSDILRQHFVEATKGMVIPPHAMETAYANYVNTFKNAYAQRQNVMMQNMQQQQSQQMQNQHQSQAMQSQSFQSQKIPSHHGNMQSQQSQMQMHSQQMMPQMGMNQQMMNQRLQQHSSMQQQQQRHQLAGHMRPPVHAQTAQQPSVPLVHKRTIEQITHYNVVKQRISDSYGQDLTAIQNCNAYPFKGIADATQRLLPFHLHHEPKEESDLDTEELMAGFREQMAEYDEIMTRDKEVCSTNAVENFASG
jgi:Conserved region of unknown function on GLTSCR protein